MRAHRLDLAGIVSSELAGHFGAVEEIRAVTRERGSDYLLQIKIWQYWICGTRGVAADQVSESRSMAGDENPRGKDGVKRKETMYERLSEIYARPEPFEFYTAADLWTDKHIAMQMLSFHLNEDVDLASRNARFVDTSVEWICSRFNVATGTRIADFGCGPGLYAMRLSQTGAQVTGIDFSQSSIDYARQYARGHDLNIDYTCTNYLDFETEDRFDLIIMIFCDHCALSPEQRQIMLRKYRSLLAPGGHLLLDVHSVSYFDGAVETAVCARNHMNGFWSPDDYFAFHNRFKYEDEKVTLDKYTIVEPDRIRMIYNWLQFYTPDSLRGEMEQAGLTVIEVLGDVAGAPYSAGNKDFAVVASCDAEFDSAIT